MKKIILFALIIVTISCKEKKEKAEIKADENVVEMTEEAIKLAKIELGGLQKMAFEDTRELKGKIMLNPKNHVSISIPAEGIVKSVEVNLGDKVHIGQVLATFYNAELIEIQREYLKAKAQNAYYSKDIKRQKDLNEQKAVSDKTYESVKREYDVNEVDIHTLKEKLLNLNVNPNTLSPKNIKKKISIVSTTNGIISKINVHNGKCTSMGEAMFEMSNQQNPTAIFSAFEKDIPYLSEGLSIAIKGQNSAETIHSTIKSIGTSMNSDNSLDVFVPINHPNIHLLGNSIIYGKVKITHKEALAIPTQALVFYENKNYIFYQSQKGIFKWQEVITGVSNDSFTQIQFIAPNFNINKNWVLKGSYPLLMKMKNKE